MAVNRGKQFEERFKLDFLKLENSSLDRLYDVMYGYKAISQISDYIGYIYPNIYYLEIKTHYGNTWPLSNLTQFDKLMKKVGIPGVRTGVVLWMIDHEKIVYLPVATVDKMKKDGKKSFNIKMIDTKEYRFFEIPTVQKRVFLEGDYSILKTLEDGD